MRESRAEMSPRVHGVGRQSAPMRKEPSSREESVRADSKGKSIEKRKDAVRALVKCTEYWKFVTHWNLCLTI